MAQISKKRRSPLIQNIQGLKSARNMGHHSMVVNLTNARPLQDAQILEVMFTSHLSSESRISQLIYGATATNLIICVLPTTNAVANTTKDAGTENMNHYRECKKAYLGIDNIQSMRVSLNKVIKVLRESEVLTACLSSSAIIPRDHPHANSNDQ